MAESHGNKKHTLNTPLKYALLQVAMRSGQLARNGDGHPALDYGIKRRRRGRRGGGGGGGAIELAREVGKAHEAHILVDLLRRQLLERLKHSGRSRGGHGRARVCVCGAGAASTCDDDFPSAAPAVS